MPQPTVLWNLTLALAFRTVGARRVQRVNASGLKLQLGNMRVDHNKLLLNEQDAIRQPELVDLALLGALPRAQIPDRDRQGFEGFRTEEVQAFVIVATPNFVTHSNSDFGLWVTRPASLGARDPLP